MCGRWYSTIRLRTGRSGVRRATGGSGARGESTCGRSLWKICGSGGLLDYQESGFDAVVRNTVPHHACASYSHRMAELDFLAGVQRGVRVHGAKTAVAVVNQLASNLLRGRIGEA